MKTSLTAASLFTLFSLVLSGCAPAELPPAETSESRVLELIPSPLPECPKSLQGVKVSSPHGESVSFSDAAEGGELVLTSAEFTFAVRDRGEVKAQLVVRRTAEAGSTAGVCMTNTLGRSENGLKIGLTIPFSVSREMNEFSTTAKYFGMEATAGTGDVGFHSHFDHGYESSSRPEEILAPQNLRMTTFTKLSDGSFELRVERRESPGGDPSRVATAVAIVRYRYEKRDEKFLQLMD